MRNRFIYIFLFLFIPVITIQSCQNEDSITYKRYFVNGKGLYEKNCQNCHGADGKGLGTLYPPLTDSTYLIANKQKLACIIRNGQTEQITINNVVYQGKMPGNNNLADIDIAQLIVYITNSFGNKQGQYDQAEVARDLAACK
ncbi:MAG: cytochrome c [Daejeonella sp.]|uniref:c-type cytochrome n=1 Tax=Daejeonella sp. TaxID=2805397 RepID=UPI0027361916|nr:cytochrome c [Daejeonella sp.]MDP3469869.1 cytochrome c [Daejeonella sp.]